MNQNWKERMQKHIQDWKNDSGIVHAVKMLCICIIAVVIYAVIAHFNLGVIGFLLRGLCVGVLAYILYQVSKSE